MRRKLWRRDKTKKKRAAAMDLNVPSTGAAGARRPNGAPGATGTTTATAMFAHQQQQQHLAPENVATVPPPGLSGPSQAVFCPHNSNLLAFVAVVPKPSSSSSSSSSSKQQQQQQRSSSTSSSSTSRSLYRPLTSPTSDSKNTGISNFNATNTITQASISMTNPTERVLMYIDLSSSLASSSAAATEQQQQRKDKKQKAKNEPKPLLVWRKPTIIRHQQRRMDSGGSMNSNSTTTGDSLEEKLRRERQRLSSSAGSLTQFSWVIASAQQPQPSQQNQQQQPRILIPVRGSLYIQNGIASNNNDDNDNDEVSCICIHDKSATGLTAIDAQLSPDGQLVAWNSDGEIYVQSAVVTTTPNNNQSKATKMPHPPVRITFGAVQNEQVSISHGVADFVAQEEMDRYRGFWWSPDSNSILFTRNDESQVPLYRIMHHNTNAAATTPTSNNSSNNSQQQQQQQESSSHGGDGGSQHGGGSSSSSSNKQHDSSSTCSSMFEDHRYPFAGKMNPSVKLGIIPIDRASILLRQQQEQQEAVVVAVPDESRDAMNVNDNDDDNDDPMDTTTSTVCSSPQDIAEQLWKTQVQWWDAPREANEYLARVHWLPSCCVSQWQNRAQTCTVLYRMDIPQHRQQQQQQPSTTTRGRTLLVERSDVWINLHHMFHVLPRAIHPDEICDGSCSTAAATTTFSMPKPLPEKSFSFLFASERTGYSHLYLYTYCPGINGEQAVLLKPVTSGKWIVESIVGVDLEKDVVYFTGTYDSVLQRHLYAVPLLGQQNKHTWRIGASARNATTNSTDFDEILPQQQQQQHRTDTTSTTSAATMMPPPTAVQSSGSDESVGLTGRSTSTITTYNNVNVNSSNANNGGVRRSLSKVMNALSGKGQRSNDDDDQNVEIRLVVNQNDLEGPTRLTSETGMHSIVMDDDCRYFVDTCSDLDRPTTVKIYELPTDDRPTTLRRILTLYDAKKDDPTSTAAFKATGKGKSSTATDLVKSLPAPELISFPTSDGMETLHAAVYKPDPMVHGPGPYPVVCAVYGGPHVQRVNRSWSQCADMRAQRLRSLGFCVIKCDNRGSSRRGLAFESAISRRLGRIEVLDQVAAVRQLIVRGIADPSRVGVYGWSYGGYLSAMCLCRAPDVFHVAVAGAPVTSWDGYDTHYTERYMGLPADNPAGYRESAVFDHVPNMRGKLMIVHGLIDENVHFRHTSRLINKLIAAGKDYDLLIFPEERHSPRRLRDRIYMEQRISEYFVRHLGASTNPTALDLVASLGGGQGLRTMAGHL